MNQTLSPEAHKSLIERLQNHISAECHEIDTERAYDEMLDDIYADNLKGPFEHLSPSRILREMSPTDYRCGFADFTDSRSDEWTEVDGYWYETKEVDEAKESFLDALRSDLEGTEKELADEENDDDPSNAPALREQVKRLEAEIAAVESHSF